MSRLIKTEPSIVFPFYQGDNILNALSKKITCSRSEADKVATRVNAKGLIEQVDANQLRLDYDPVTRQCLGLLVEPAATNLLKYSQDFENGVWEKTNTAILQGTGVEAIVTSNNAIAPDGTLTADSIFMNIGSGRSFSDRSGITQNISISSVIGATYTYSIYLRAKTGSPTISLFLGGINSAGGVAISPILTNTWTRYSVSQTANIVGNPYVRLYLWGATATTDTADIEFWGAQLEEGSYPTSYIKTTNAAVTRNADIVTYEGQGFQSAYNQNEGTWIVQVSGLKDGLSQGILAPVKADDELGTRTGAMLKDMNNNIDMAFGGTYVNNVIQSSEYNLESLNKFGIKYAKTGVSAYSNGSLIYNSALLPSLLIDKLSIGSWIQNIEFLNGHIHSLVYYPVALTDEQIQSRTKLSTL